MREDLRQNGSHFHQQSIQSIELELQRIETLRLKFNQNEARATLMRRRTVAEEVRGSTQRTIAARKYRGSRRFGTRCLQPELSEALRGLYVK